MEDRNAPPSGLLTVLFRVRLRRTLRPLGCAHVKQQHVVVGGAGFGRVDADALAGGAFHLHGLRGEGDGSDAGVVKGLLCGLAAGDLIAFPEPGEVGAFEEEFADQVGQVPGAGGGRGSGRGCGAWLGGSVLGTRLSKAFLPSEVSAVAWCSPLPTSRPG